MELRTIKVTPIVRSGNLLLDQSYLKYYRVKDAKKEEEIEDGDQSQEFCEDDDGRRSFSVLA